MHPSRPPGSARATSPSSQRLLRQLASQARLLQIAHRSRSALEKAHDRRSDNRTKVIGRLHAVHPTANSQVEELPMQAPGYFQLTVRQSSIRFVHQASDTPQFEAQRLYDPLLDQIEVMLGDADALEPGKNKDPNPVVSEERRKIGLIEVDQAPFEWFRRVVEDSLPLGLPPIQVDLFVDALDQGLFGWKIAEQILVGNAKTFRQVAETTIEADLGEEGDRTVQDLPLTILRVQAAPPLRGKRISRRVHHPAASLLCRSAYPSSHCCPIAFV